MWFENFTGSSITSFTKTDQMDFTWWWTRTGNCRRIGVTSSSLRSAHIHAYGLRLANGHTGAQLLQLKNVKVKDVIEFLSQLGVKYVNCNDTAGVYKIQLSGPTPAQYTGVDFYLNGSFLANNPL